MGVILIRLMFVVNAERLSRQVTSPLDAPRLEGCAGEGHGGGHRVIAATRPLSTSLEGHTHKTVSRSRRSAPLCHDNSNQT